MRKTSVDGIGTIYGGSYDEVSVDGIGKLKGDLKANKINVNGVFKSKGRIEADTFIIDGVCRINNDIKVSELKIDGVLKARHSKIESENINCDGIIVCSGEVSADNIHIEGLCSITELYGDKINIKYDVNRSSKGNLGTPIKFLASSYFGRPVSTSHSLVDTIECTDLEASHLKVKSIRAKNVILGPDCIVDYLECDGTLEVHPSCKIGKAIRDIKTESRSIQDDYKGTTNTKITIDKIIKDKNLDKADPRVKEIINKYQDGKLSLREANLMLDALSSTSK